VAYHVRAQSGIGFQPVRADDRLEAYPTILHPANARFMMLTLPIYCTIIALASAMGGFIQKIGSPDLALGICLFGLLFMFFLIRMFHFHQHDLAVDTQHDHIQKELCDDGHDHHHVHCDQHHGQVDLSWAGLCLGLAIHTIIDGIALAAAVSGSSAMSFAGLGLVVNLVFATMCPLGAILFAFGVDNMVDGRDMILGVALAFSAGVFLCISLGDLLPEVHFHSHDRLHLSMMLLLGVLLALAIEFLPGHSHNYSPKVDPQNGSAASAVIHGVGHRATF